jgi:ribosomal protein S27AE
MAKGKEKTAKVTAAAKARIKEAAAPKMCARCGGDGFYHSPKTGYRAETATEPLIDKNRKCPACDGSGRA